jgi:hypothetical protein
MEKIKVTKSNQQKLTKFTFCELISFLEFQDFKICLLISKTFRNAMIFYQNLYVNTF